MEYSVSYDYRDYIDEEERQERCQAEIGEMAKYEDKAALIEFMKRERKRRGLKTLKLEDMIIPNFSLDDYLKQNGLKEEERLSDDEVRKLLAELDEYKKKIAPDQVDELNLEQMIKESREAYSEIQMYDFGLGKKSNHQAIMDFYGHDLYRQIEKEIRESYDAPHDRRQQGHISTKLWQKLKDIRAGRIPRPQKHHKNGKSVVRISEENENKPPSESTKKIKNRVKVMQRERQPGDDYFLTVERGLIKNESYVDLFKGPDTVYQVLWANIVREGWRDSKEYPIREKYYDKRKQLVYCSTYRHVAEQCRMSHNTVKGIIDRFKEAGVVKVETFIPEGRRQGQTVFILGNWTGNGKNYKEHLFRDKIFLSPKLVKK